MSKKDEVVAQIADLKEQIAACKGTPCEVYSRVVGYLRPVQNWNKGKKDEFTMRKTFNVERCSCGD
ncbi:MAG: anaerobic ribonucleoside-triphosphate reductase [Candidatus Avelusimicrobium sp.]|uniref:anaerobic ribonucleoside-triphosphate reductase n=1 Tax=Candidatus Avelusimicrobium sp. TaxID=3048833 RepID=UPI003EFD18DE